MSPLPNVLSSFVTFVAISILSYGPAFAGSKFEDKTTAECLEDNSCQQAILNRIETRMGGLDYNAGYPTSATVERLYDEMDYQRAVLAHQISDNLVSYYSMHVGPRESIKGSKMGDLVIWSTFLDTKGLVLTGNDTTVYGMVYLDLGKNGPMVVKVPKSPFLGSILDLWQVPLSGRVNATFTKMKTVRLIINDVQQLLTGLTVCLLSLAAAPCITWQWLMPMISR